PGGVSDISTAFLVMLLGSPADRLAERRPVIDLEPAAVDGVAREEEPGCELISQVRAMGVQVGSRLRNRSRPHWKPRRADSARGLVRWCSSPAECAVPSPEREDYLRTRIEHRLGFRAAPVCTCEIDSREAGTMRKLIFGMNVTLDGYIAAPGDDIGWSGPPSDELFQWWLDQERASDLSLYGRKLWETMSSYWPTGDQQSDATPAKIGFA